MIKMLKYVRRIGPVVWERHEALDTTTAAVTNDYNILHLNFKRKHIYYEKRK
jgi:hypothetical protein